MFSRIDHGRRLRNTFWRRCMCVSERSCACVYVPISWERNGTFLVKVFIRFLVKVPNFSTASDTYVYLCIIYHNVSRAVYVYFCYPAKPPSLARKKRTSVQLPFFSANSRVPRRRNFRHRRKNHVITITSTQSFAPAKFHFIVIPKLP